MTRQHSIFQVWYTEEFDDHGWEKHKGRLWTRKAAELRVRRLRADRPTRWYRIEESVVTVETHIIWQSNLQEKIG